MTRVINENDFVNLLQLSLQKQTSKNVITIQNIKNKIIYRDNKSLNDKHIIVKKFLTQLLEFVFEKFYFEKNRCFYYNAY